MVIEDERIKELTLQLYNKLMEKPLAIKEIFEDYFGEKNVDLIDIDYDSFLSVLKRTPIRSLGSLTGLTPVQKTLYEGINEETLVSDYILIKYFGEELLPFIDNLIANTLKMYVVVYFPKVTVTNEYNKSIEIYDVYVRQQIKGNGTALYRPQLTRSTLTRNQFISGYVHSHVHSSIKVIPQFHGICTGSGPINSTITSLTVSYDEGLWRLFCVELNNLISVESVEGVPYISLESVTNKFESMGDFYMNTVYTASSRPSTYANNPFKFIDHKGFIKYLLTNDIIPFNYAKGQYGIGVSFIELMVRISNAFISWYNSLGSKKPMMNLFSTGFLFKGIIRDNAILYGRESSNASLIASLKGRFMFKFKGEDVKFNIIDDAIDNDESTFVNVNYVEEIVGSLLSVLNVGYGRKNNIIDKETRFI